MCKLYCNTNATLFFKLVLMLGSDPWAHHVELHTTCYAAFEQLLHVLRLLC